jgi:hypothetical protein
MMYLHDPTVHQLHCLLTVAYNFVSVLSQQALKRLRLITSAPLLRIDTSYQTRLARITSYAIP